MTKEEALKVLDTIPTIGEQVDALEMAIEALEREPCEDDTLKDIFCMGCEYKEQEPCDCISRQATVERLCKVAEFMNEKRNGLGSPYVMAALFIQDNKEEFPSVTPQPRTGKWIFDEILDKHYYCSKCKSMGVDYWDFCPNCGARMEVET